jgi:Ca2+-binding RTX toxin-like protein
MTVINGTSGNDYINIAGKGIVTVDAGDGQDLIVAGASFAAADQIDGGNGDNDVLRLNGDYSTNIVFNATTLQNVETLQLAAGHSYNFTLDAAFVPSPAVMFNVHANALQAGDSFTLDASAVTVGDIRFFAGAGDDTLSGSNDPSVDGDQFYLQLGGNDTVFGNAGYDLFLMGAALTSADKIDGGADYDVVYLKGDYSGGLVFLPTTMVNVEYLRMSAGFSYNLTTDDATLAAGQKLVVSASVLGSGDTLIFDGSNELDGSFAIVGGAGNDTLTGGSGDDTINLGFGGSDTAHGGGGNDAFNVGAALDSSDSIDGGAGTDRVILSGDYSAGIVLGASTLQNIEQLNFAPGYDYKITMDDANLATGQTLTVNAAQLGASDALIFDGSAETAASFIFRSGLGADSLTGGGGADSFSYSQAAQSTGASCDTIGGFDFTADKFDFGFTVRAIDRAVTTGALDTANFDNDLTAALSGHLGTHHAVLFTPDSGDLSGQTFLIVDANNSTGYQAGADFVFHLTNAANIASLDTGDFI